MTFQLTDFPRLLPELMLFVTALLVVGGDLLEQRGSAVPTPEERAQNAANLSAVALGLVFIIVLVQSAYLFSVPEPRPAGGINTIVNVFINLGRNLQNAGPSSAANAQPILGAFATDQLGTVARLIFVGAALITVLLAWDEPLSGNPSEFYGLLLFATAGMCIMAAATELILAYLALELSSIALYVLAGYFRNDPRSSEAGIKYFLFGALSSGILLYGMSLAYGFTASVNSAQNASDASSKIISTTFSAIATASVSAGTNAPLLTLAVLFIVGGIGYKIGVVPFHGWVPDVYQGAPTVVTAFIATASKTSGFILLFRLLTAAFPSLAGSAVAGAGFSGWTGLLALLALVTLVIGNLSALPQTNAKRLLAYSSIAHAGFVLLAFLLWSVDAPAQHAFSLTALIFYLIIYSLTNLGAFGALAAISTAVGGDDLRDLNGLARRNLRLAVVLSVLVLSLAGVPPLAGFLAKLLVFMAGYRAGAGWLVDVAVGSTVISLYYYLRFLKAMWINAPTADTPVQVPRMLNIALVTTTVLVVLLGLLPNVLINILDQMTLVAGK